MPEASVLIVDDEPNVVRLCRRLLERDGYHVMMATEPSQGLSILTNQPVDLLLVDIRMPGMDGFQLLSTAHRYQPDLAALIMTGYGTLDTAMAALQQGADGLLLKPFRNVELIDAVHHALEARQGKRDLARLSALRPLFDITEALFTETDPDRLHNLIVSAVCKNLSCMYTGLYQRLTNQGTLRLVAACGSWFPAEILDEENDLLGRVVLGGVPIRVHQGGSGNPEYQNFLNKFQLGSLICVPVEQKEGSSLLIAARQESEPVFREADQEMLLILSRQSAAALENARLYAELRSYVKQVEKSRAAMLQTEKLVAAGRLTASIAHEINNPLQSLSNCLHLTSRKELSPEDRQKYLTMAQIELDRLMAIVQRMLDFYRPGARDRKLHDINEIVKRVLSLLEPQLLKGNIAVRCNLEPDLPLIFVMSSQIQQVLLNLFINSMEAMPGGGEMVIETTRIKPDDFSMADGPGERAIVITISDNGPGIPESEREQLFEPFVSTKETGTGLGLAVSYGIIAAHGGTIDLVDVPKGACFRVILPEDKKQ